MKQLLILAIFFAVFVSCKEKASSLSDNENFVLLDSTASLHEIVQAAAKVRPSLRQYSWQQTEFNAFIHFGMNTFTDREWGQGNEDPAWFNPDSFDAEQWARVLKEAGVRIIIVTAKHHDGFCLWPSAFTDHSVRNSSWKNGRGDVVGEVAAACRKYGLKFGFYLSPWDRHEPTYGSEAYNTYFKNQLRELLTQYGDVSEVWFDGACGEGPNGKRQVYDWAGYYALIRELQPNAVIAIMGPDVRWIGTETGYGRETEWSVLPAQWQDPRLTAQLSQKDIHFIPSGDKTAEDLGSRQKLIGARKLVWYPAEADVSIRPGWFYHTSEDERVKSPYKLMDIYFNSVGKNAVLLLNVPPDKHGRIHANDVKALRGFRKLLDQTFDQNLALAPVELSCTSQAKDHPAEMALNPSDQLYWMADRADTSAQFYFHWKQSRTFNCLLLQEQILVGQRIEAFLLEVNQQGSWQPVARGTTVGYKRLLRFKRVTTNAARLTILRSRLNPTLRYIGLFNTPPTLKFEPEQAAFHKKLTVQLHSDQPTARIFFTTDGSTPNIKSKQFHGPLKLTKTTTIQAIALGPDGKRSLVHRATYVKALFNLQLSHAFDPRYSGGGLFGLLDGRKGSLDFKDGRWQGYEAFDFEAMIDLEKQRSVQMVKVGFLQDYRSWIFLPREVQIAWSNDGVHFKNEAVQKSPLPPTKQEPVRYEFSFPLNKPVRYLRIKAKNLGRCPKGHPGAGGKAWLFVDEIEVQ